MKYFSKISFLVAFLVFPLEGYAASQTIWGAADAGPVAGTYRIPVDTSSSSSPGQVTATELSTFMWNSPTLVTPALGTPASGVVTNLTGTAGINITGTAPAGSLTGTTLNSTVVTSSLTSVGTIASGTWHGSVVGASYGGTGVANTATLTLGSSAVNLATLGTGIVKNTTTTGALTNAASADIVALFSGCSGTQYLGADGACHNTGGSGVSSFTGDGTILNNSASTGAVTATLATQTANTVLGAVTATTPSGLALPSCNAATKALGYTSGTGFTCNSSVQPTITLTTTGTSGPATFTSSTLNIPQYSNSTFQQAMAAETQLSIGGL